MITVTVEKRYGAATVRARVSAPTIERALELAGPNARVQFPIDGEAFFADVTEEGIDFGSMTLLDLRIACEAGLPGVEEFYTDLAQTELRDPVLAAEYAGTL